MSNEHATKKAYAVQDGYEGYGCVVFATNGATARREGAAELGIEFEDVESCRRAPEFDQFAPGPVSPLVLIDHGWWFECSHCNRRVGEGMADDLEVDGLDPNDFVPRSDGREGVFCSAACECADHRRKRGRQEAEAALIEVFEAKFPGAAAFHYSVYGGPKLDERCGVTFGFPGGVHPASWHFGEESVFVAPMDVGAYKAWRAAA